MNGSHAGGPRRDGFDAFSRHLVAVSLIVLGGWTGGSRLYAQQPGAELSASAAQQINALIAAKAARTPAQRKISSQLIFAIKMDRGEPIAAGVTSLSVNLPDRTARGVVVDVRAAISDQLLADMRALGAEIIDVSSRYRSVRLRIDLLQIDLLAEMPDILYIQPKQEAITSRRDGDGAMPALASVGRPETVQQARRLRQGGVRAALQQSLQGAGPITSVGSVTSEGDVTHKVNVARATYGVSGAGVRIGVLSDGVVNLAASQASGDLGPVTVLPGQAGSGDEGTAMLEIVHDLAPDAELYFATAFTSMASFAENIRALAAAGCDIIVDDVSYFVESPFQDGQLAPSPTNGAIVAQAVKDVASAGVLFFSSASNSGNKNDGESGTWEGDYLDAGIAGAPLTGAGQLHNFGGQAYNVLTASSTNPIVLFWSDPLGVSGNDYDLYRLDSTGTTVLAVSDDVQNGDDDPVEGVSAGVAGQRIVVAKFNGAARFLHLGTNRNRLQISTAGETHGHSSTTAPNSFGVAATPVRGPYPNPFNSGNQVETFSSDGPRRIFFTATGAAITPGNVLSTGGQVLQKPDFTAADGVAVSGAGGFPTAFFGTSAAAPHAAVIAALVQSRNLAQTPAQIRAALFASAIDIEASGVDRDSGAGIIMADTAVAAATMPSGTPARSDRGLDLDDDGRTDLAVFRPGNGTWYVRSSSTNYDPAQAQTFQWGLPGDIAIAGDFEGDGRADLTVYRPSNGTWYIRFSVYGYAVGSAGSVQWGLPGDVPIAGDLDGDGITDLTIYRPSNGTWYVRYSSNGFTIAGSRAYQWGLSGDLPITGDFDGDGRIDLSVFRPANGTWYIRYSSLGLAVATARAFQWGLNGDTPLVGDFDGDGQSDLTVFRPSIGGWFVNYSSQGYAPGSASYFQWGLNGDVPVAGDFDGDGRTELTVFRPNTATWFVRYSSLAYSDTNYFTYQWGLPGDAVIR